MSDQTVHVGTNPVGAQHVEARFVKIESAVDGLREDIGTIKSGVKEINDSVSARSRPNFALVAIVVTLFTFSVGAIWVLFSVYSAHVENAIDEQKANAAKFLPGEVINAQNAASKEIADLKSQLEASKSEQAAARMIETSGKALATKADLAAESQAAATRSEYNRLGRLELRERVMKLEDNIVSRREHEVRNAQVDHAIEAGAEQERRDVDEIKRRLDDLYPTSTVLKDLSERTHSLELQLRATR